MNYHSKHKTNGMAIIGREKLLLEENFPFLKCRFQNNLLYCNGAFKPHDNGVEYQYRIKFDGISRPIVTVKHPRIEYNDDIHMYPKDNSLCLYYPGEFTWDPSKHLHTTIIPWTHEWFVFYELYKCTGQWLHPFVPHVVSAKKEKV